jgi:hypothetical protein
LGNTAGVDGSKLVVVATIVFATRLHDERARTVTAPKIGNALQAKCLASGVLAAKTPSPKAMTKSAMMNLNKEPKVLKNKATQMNPPNVVELEPKNVSLLTFKSSTLAPSPLPQTIYQSFLSGIWTGLLWVSLFIIFLWLVSVFRTRSPPIPTTLQFQQRQMIARNPVAQQLDDSEPGPV